MMNSKKLITVILLLVVLLAFPLKVFAMDAATAEISFTVNSTPSTVVMEAVDDAPLPEQTVFEKALEGKFEISYTYPGDYYYKVYQKAGTEKNVTYDSTVYMVRVTALVNEDNILYPVVTVYVENSSQKADSIGFVNTFSDAETNPPELEGTPSNPENNKPDLTKPSTPDTNGKKPYTGDDSYLELWILLMVLSFAVLTTATVMFKRTSRSSEKM